MFSARINNSPHTGGREVEGTGLEMRPPLYHPVPLHPNKSDNQRVFRIRDVISWRRKPTGGAEYSSEMVANFCETNSCARGRQMMPPRRRSRLAVVGHFDGWAAAAAAAVGAVLVAPSFSGQLHLCF